MNWHYSSRVWRLAYEMLSTGLFTRPRFYSQDANAEKPNIGGPFPRFASPGEPPKTLAPAPVVDKFPPPPGAKTAGWKYISIDYIPPKALAGVAGPFRVSPSDGGRRRRGDFFPDDRFFSFDVGEAALAFFNFIGLFAHKSLH